MRLSIVIPSFDTRDLLLECLGRLRPLAGEAEVIVVDNASADGTAAAVAAAHPWARLLRNEANLGFAAAVNRGWRAAGGDLLLFLNSDTRPDPASVLRLAAALESRPEAGIAGPFLRLADGRPQTGAAGWDLTVGTALAHQLLLHRLMPRLCRGFYLHQPAFAGREAVEVGWVSGAAMMVRRSVAERLGGMAEEFFMYAEDVDFCRRAREAGCRVLWLPGVEIVHLHAGAAWDGPPPVAWLESTIRYHRRRHPAWKTRLVALAFAAGSLLRLAASLPPAALGRPGAAGRVRRYGSWLGVSLVAVLRPPG